MAAKQGNGKAEATAGHKRFPYQSSLTPCPAGARRRACRPARIAPQQLLVGLMVLTAMPALAQTAPAATGDADSGTGWAVTGDLDDISVHAVGVTPEPLPKITITATRDTIYGGLEDLRFELKREKPGDSLTVKLWLQQDEDWLIRRVQTRYVYFYPQDTVAVLRVHRSQFNPDVTRLGCIIAKVVEAKGYNINRARAPVWVISSPAPFVTLFIPRSPDSFAEGEGRGSPKLYARMMLGMPRGVEISARLESRGRESLPAKLTATSGTDFEPIDETVVIPEDGYEMVDGWWMARTDLSVQLVDDDLREGTETFELTLQAPSGQSPKVEYLNGNGTECWGRCKHLIYITDDEEIPAMNLSVSEDAILEEGETSSIARVSITDAVRFADEQLVTLALGGTATMGADYAVSPADADRGMPDYQVVLPARSTSAEVTLKAMSDEVDDPGEMIEVSAALDGDAIGDMHAIEIMNQEIILPTIALAANRETIIAGLEDLEFTLTREGPLSESLTVAVQLAQDQRWLPFTSCPLTFGAGQATATATLRRSQFSAAVVQSGQLTASVQSIDGYDVHGAAVSVFVVSQEGPAVTISFSEDDYRFEEDSNDPSVTLVAQAAAGMPRGATVRFSVGSRSGTATSGEDFRPVSETITIAENDFVSDHGSWRVHRRLSLRLLDDQVREGAESFDLLLERAPGQSEEVQLSGGAGTPVEITDDEDIPAFSLSVSKDEIREEDETSSTATVSIDNGKSFASDEMVTFAFSGTATQGDDYKVSPADADRAASGHQVALRAGSKSAKVTLAARKDDVGDPNEKIDISVTHAGDAIGSGSIRIRDFEPVLGPTVEVTFDGVTAAQDPLDKGTATGPFTARFTFSEPIRGFEQERIRWQTHAETTVDGTPIGVLMWDFTEVRRSVEYSVRMMPTQNGRLWVGVKAGQVTSVATGAGNRFGNSAVRIEFPADRLLVAPTQLEVDEGDGRGADFLVVLTSAPTGAVEVTMSGMEGTQVKLDHPNVRFARRFWNSGRGVTAMAGVDADSKDETVTLTLSASGGGYDGKSAKVVVTVRDNQSGSGGDSAGDIVDEASDLILVEGVTPEVAAAALFGERGLSEVQLAALDRLGNGNGAYDLGDMLSWAERCERGEANCGSTSSAASNAIPGAAALAAAGQGSRSSQRRHQDSDSRQNRRTRRHQVRAGKLSRRRPDGLSRHHPSRAWYSLVILLAATMTWGCGEDVVQPSVEPDPGLLTVWLTATRDVSDSGAMLLVEGPGIESLQAPGLRVFQSGNATSKQIIVSGALTTGAFLELQVPDRTLRGQYRVELLQVAGDDYSLRDLSSYRTMILR